MNSHHKFREIRPVKFSVKAVAVDHRGIKVEEQYLMPGYGNEDVALDYINWLNNTVEGAKLRIAVTEALIGGLDESVPENANVKVIFHKFETTLY